MHDVDHDHSAHRVYLNSPDARDMSVINCLPLCSEIFSAKWFAIKCTVFFVFFGGGGLFFSCLVTFALRILTVSSRYCYASIIETLVNLAPDTSDIGERPYTANKVS